MEHFKEGQYDDDLTQGSYDDDLTADGNDYDDDFETGEIDLFGFTDDEDSVLGRLKSIILSIEWEITNDILRQFNEELVELKNIWAGNKVNLIYVQALEKISKYIYKEKSSAHPNAIKLLLTFYSNLERIESDDSISESEKKTILRTDIELFEKLKKQISQAIPTKATEAPVEDEPIATSPISEQETDSSLFQADETSIAGSVVEKSGSESEDQLLTLKAIVYGIDWEVTENDLQNLSSEVKRLEAEFSDSKAKKIFLQGIGSLGSYINLKRSDAHADAFKLLHSFFVGLETVVNNNLSGQAEKDILLPQVEKFNVFKGIIAETISPERIKKTSPEPEEEVDDFDDGEIQPAFADVPEDIHGFQEGNEDVSGEADEYFAEEEEVVVEETPVDSALASEMESRLDGMFDEPPEEAVSQLDKQRALQGVNVETEDDDDSEEEPLPEEGGELAPALAAEEPFSVEESPAVFTDKDEDLFEEPQVAETELLGSEVPGVDVEHEADDESDEEPLPFEGDEYAPALSGDGGDEESKSKPEETDRGDIDSRLDNFFGDTAEEENKETEPIESLSEEVEEELVEPVKETDEITGRISDFFGDSAPDSSAGDHGEAIKGVDVETEDDDDSEEEPLPLDGDEFAPALSGDVEFEDQSEDYYDDEDSLVESQEEAFEESVESESQDTSDDIDDRFDELFGEGGEEEEEAKTEFVSEEVSLDEEEEIEEPSFTFGEDEEPGKSGDLDELFAAEEDADQLTQEDEEVSQEEDFVLEPELSSGDELLSADSISIKEEEAEKSTDVSGFEEAGFEEILDEEIEDIPEEILAEGEEPQTVEASESTNEEDILAYFADDDQEDQDEESEQFDDEDQQPIAAFSDDVFEEDIPEMEVDDLATVIDDGSGVSAAGSIPSGYPSTDELLREFGEIAGEDLSEESFHPEGNEDFIIGIEQPEATSEHKDEVVFKEVDESLGMGEQEEDSTFGITLLDDEKYSTRKEEEIEDAALFEEPAISEEETETPTDIRPSAYVRPHGDAPLHESLGGMRNCIASLGLEIDSEILNNLSGEIEKLRHLWMDKPAEKTFIQLLSTITSHISRYRYDADKEANKLLLSVFDKLELTALGQASENEIQESLLNETSKVLQWQARLIDRTSVTSDGIKEEQSQSASAEQEPALLGEAGGDEFSIGLDAMSRKVEEIGDDMVMQRVSSIMKEELEQLKRDFQAELQELRKDILKGSGRE